MDGQGEMSWRAGGWSGTDEMDGLCLVRVQMR